MRTHDEFVTVTHATTGLKRETTFPHKQNTLFLLTTGCCESLAVSDLEHAEASLNHCTSHSPHLAG